MYQKLVHVLIQLEASACMYILIQLEASACTRGSLHACTNTIIIGMLLHVLVGS